MHILILCIAMFCYSLLKNDISKLTDTRFSNDVKKDVGKHVGKHVRKYVGKHVKKLARFRLSHYRPESGQLFDVFSDIFSDIFPTYFFA